jgi:hypothetical protein
VASPTLTGAGELIDDELLDTLPPMEADSMVLDQDFAIIRESKRQKPCTPPFNTPSSPEQASGKSSSGGLATYCAVDLQQKRAARLARNRQSAQELRNRKRQYAERVGQENETLKLQSSQLQARVSSLTAENNLLREENNFYRGMLAGRSATPVTPSVQTPDASQRTVQLSTAGKGKSARGVGILASLLAVIGMTANQDQVPSTMDSPSLFAGDTVPPSYRRALDETDEAGPDERLALPDKSLLMRREHSSATVVASDVGLVIRNAAAPLIPSAEGAEPSSIATLQLGTRRFILATADSAVRWAATPVAGTDSLDGEQDSLALQAPIAVEQDDYILGGPTRRVTASVTQQYSPDAAEVPTGTAVALSWTEDDTIEFLVRMLATMDVSEKQQVINMLVREYGAHVFGGLFERAIAAAPDAGEQQISTDKLSESLGMSASTSTAEESAVKGLLPCDCALETGAAVVVADAAQSATHVSG